jgi:hypothetical protein
VLNASITLADFWRTHRAIRNRSIVGGVPVGDMTGPAPRRFALALAQGMLAARPAGASAASVPLSIAAGDEKPLLAAAPADDSSVRLANRVGLFPTSILRIDAEDAEGSELHTVDALLPPAIPATEPSTVRLDHALLSSHAPGARVDHMTIPAGPLPPIPLLDAAERGDRTLLLNALPSTGTTGTRISGGGVDDEYHDCSLYAATADSAGYFRLPPLHRLAQVRLDVSDGVTTSSFFVDPDYTTREQWLDLVIP